MKLKKQSIRVSTTVFSLNRERDESQFWKRVEALVAKAHHQKSKIILFPEYFCLSWLVGEFNRTSKAKGNFKKILSSFVNKKHEFLSKLKRLSNQYKLVIVAGTVPELKNKRLINRCYVFNPNGKVLFQDKEYMTRFEDEHWGVKSGGPKRLIFNVGTARLGVAICYDIEFYNPIKRLSSKGVDVVLVPSCTDDVHGYWRVRHCAEARAIESQSYVVMSSVVGGDRRYSEIDIHYGGTAVFGPCDKEFNPGGIVGIGKTLGVKSRDELLTVELDLKALRKTRANGTVFRSIE